MLGSGCAAGTAAVDRQRYGTTLVRAVGARSGAVVNPQLRLMRSKKE